MSDDSDVMLGPSAPAVALSAPPVAPSASALAPITYPSQGIAMIKATARRAAPKRNAQPKSKPKRVPPRHRNAAPPPPRPRPAAAAAPSTKKDTLVHLVETLGGAAVTSLVGALAVRWGLRPELVSAGLSGVGGYTAWASDSERNRFVGLGAASAAGSQLLLIKLNPKATATPAPPQVAVRLPAPAAPPRVKNADLGTLPPGMLEAAFERARAELAVAGDGYPADYDHAYHRAP